MKKISLLVILIINLTLFSKAQDNNANIWYFGENAGVDFNTGVPSAIMDGQINTQEGCASICDINGSLLFYTDGSNIWNSQHQIMPNGSGLLGSFSATQSAVIVPRPHYSGSETNNIYYVFTIDNWQHDLVNGFNYSVVDMSLDNGLGDIISTQKNISLHGKVSEKICAVMHTNNKDVWIVTHDWDSNDFLVYLLTEDSIATTPIVSSVGGFHGGSYINSVGYMKATIDGLHIAVAIHSTGNDGKFEAFDFNRSSGELSNPKIASGFHRPYGIEFSPDGTKLYASTITWASPPSNLYQFDLEASDFSASMIQIESSTVDNIMALQLAPNGKIYVAIDFNEYLGVISNPDNSGLSCNYENQDLYLNSRICKYGLPNQFYYKGFQFFTGSERDTTICAGDSIYLEDAYQNTEGIYQDITSSYQGWDSIINTQLLVSELLPNPTITENEGVLSSSLANNYQWYLNGELISGANSQTYQPFITGTYQVAIENSNGCVSFSDEYNFIYVGVLDLEKNLKIYPNPVKDILLIHSNELFVITITDIKGQELWIDNTKTKFKEIDTSVLHRGIYLVKITSSNSSIVKRIAKE